MKSYSFMLMGSTGSGKTHSAATMLDCAGIEKVCFLFTEPSDPTLDSLAFKESGLAKHLGTRLHYMRAIPTSTSWDTLGSFATDLINLSLSDLLKRKGTDKEIRLAYHRILAGLTSFTCEITGESLGKVDDWPESWCLVVDSLSGINNALKKLSAGSRPFLSFEEYQPVMGQEEEMVIRLCGALQCQVVLTAHTTRERDEVTGTSQIYCDALGSKLAPTLGRWFSDVILTKYNATTKEYLWSTVEPNTDLKARLLPRSNSLKPTFAQITQLNGESK